MHNVRIPQDTCQRNTFHFFWKLENTFRVEVEMSLSNTTFKQFRSFETVYLGEVEQSAQ
jgi:hypothetical protein